MINRKYKQAIMNFEAVDDRMNSLRALLNTKETVNV